MVRVGIRRDRENRPLHLHDNAIRNEGIFKKDVIRITTKILMK